MMMVVMMVRGQTSLDVYVAAAAAHHLQGTEAMMAYARPVTEWFLQFSPCLTAATFFWQIQDLTLTYTYA
jgi:hypothetical protein